MGPEVEDALDGWLVQDGWIVGTLGVPDLDPWAPGHFVQVPFLPGQSFAFGTSGEPLLACDADADGEVDDDDPLPAGDYELFLVEPLAVFSGPTPAEGDPHQVADVAVAGGPYLITLQDPPVDGP